MKQIIDVKLKTRKIAADIADFSTDMLVLGRFSDDKGLGKLGKELNRRVDGGY